MVKSKSQIKNLCLTWSRRAKTIRNLLAAQLHNQRWNSLQITWWWKLWLKLKEQILQRDFYHKTPWVWKSKLLWLNSSSNNSNNCNKRSKMINHRKKFPNKCIFAQRKILIRRLISRLLKSIHSSWQSVTSHYRLCLSPLSSQSLLKLYPNSTRCWK